MKKIRIISLGEIVPININQGVAELANMIAEKVKLEKGVVLPRVGKVLGMKAQMDALSEFKQGRLAEADFDALMVKALCDEFQHELEGKAQAEPKDKIMTVDDFNAAWSAMNPEFNVFIAALSAAMAFNDNKNCELIFISDTNPKDMRHLMKQLSDCGIPYQCAGEQLRSIERIKLHTTYAKHCDKPTLITGILAGLMQAEGPGLFAGNKAKVDIKYIRGVNGIDAVKAMSDAFDATNEAIQEAIAGLRVESILWDKAGENKTLTLLLQNEEKAAHGLLPVAKL